MYCAGITFLWGYDGPYWDQWYQVPLIAQAFEGTLRISDCWVLVNEHRVFFPTLLTVSIAPWTHWTLGVELAILMTLMVCAFGLIVHSIREKGAHPYPWLIPIISLLMFSYSQHNIFMWGLHVAIAMALLAMVGVVALLSRATITPKHLGAAVVLAVISSFSFGAGIVVWMVGLILLLSRVRENRKLVVRYTSAWFASAVVVMAFYFIGYEKTAANGTATDALGHPIQFVIYIFAYLGAPLAPYDGRVLPLNGWCAFAMGVFGVGAALIVLRVALGKSSLSSVDRFGLGLLAIGVCCAGLTALKQWPEGVNQATSSRYIAWSTLFWVGILLLSRERAKSWHFYPFLLTLIVVLVSAASLYGTYVANERFDAYAMGKRALITETHPEDLRFVYPTRDVVDELRPILVEYGLAQFRNEKVVENFSEKAVE